MDLHLGLFSERLKRLLAGEQRMLPLPNAAMEQVQKLQTVIESIYSSFQSDYKVEMVLIVYKLDRDITISKLQGILKEINYLVHESEKAIDTFIMSSMQQNGERSSKERRVILLEDLKVNSLILNNRCNKFK